jgi:RHS repeat-associated protein
MIDRTGAVATSYQYSDYGQALSAAPARTTRTTITGKSAANAAANPFTFNGTYTDPVTGTQVLPARIYDPAQGRFLSLDGSNMLNRYQAFDTNPIDKTDPTGHAAVSTIVTAAVTAALFLAFITSFIPVVNVLAGAVAISELSVAATVTFAANVAVAATSLGAFATSLTLAADDGVRQRDGKGFLNDKQRQDFQNATMALGIASAAFGLGGAGLAGLAGAGESSAGAAAGAVSTDTEAGAGTVSTDTEAGAGTVSTDTEAGTTAGGTELQTTQDGAGTFGQALGSDVKSTILAPQDVEAAMRTCRTVWTPVSNELSDAAGSRVMDITFRDYSIAEGNPANIAWFNSKIASQNARIVNELARIYGPDPGFEAQLAQASGLDQTELQVEAQTAKLGSAPGSAPQKMAQPDPAGNLSQAPTTFNTSPIKAELAGNVTLGFAS